MFVVTFAFLIFMCVCTVMSMVAYCTLFVLSLTLSYRGYKYAMATVQKTEQTNPFKSVAK